MPPSLLDRSMRVQVWQKELAFVNAKIGALRALYQKVKAAQPSTSAAREFQRVVAQDLLEEAKSYEPSQAFYEGKIREYTEVYDLELVSVGEAVASTNQLASSSQTANGVAKPAGLATSSKN